MAVDGGEGQTRGTGTVEPSLGIGGEGRISPGGGRGKWGPEDGQGKVERLLAEKAQVSVPDALPTWARERRHASVGHMPAKGCCNPLRETWVSVPRPPPSPCPLLRSPIAHAYSPSRTVGTRSVQQLKKLGR